MPQRKNADQIVPEMIKNGITTDELLQFSGLSEDDFAKILAGDGTIADSQYDRLIVQIQAHGKLTMKTREL
ncbi:hypothetical protein L248_0724 [Schleiferilactobacillus shenzhenensis LY-73]|uniref:Uncharacterized protein n=2 Tax=Schleiferilactobacillus shenzhenensis TaxID=1231337 RepID=U4TT76_9LACO|nr:hypothetical protein L248_0724 [Schleiferilactobacillus shenzhenensis LY-73]